MITISNLPKLNSGITELEKFNATLTEEIRQIESGDVTKTDHEKLDNLKEMCDTIESTKRKLKEDMVYYEVQRTCYRTLVSRPRLSNSIFL